MCKWPEYEMQDAAIRACGRMPIFRNLSLGESKSPARSKLCQFKICLTEPVRETALPVFPANREFYKIVASGAPETPNSGAGTVRYTKIPYSTEREILAQEQGISPAKTEIIVG